MDLCLVLVLAFAASGLADVLQTGSIFASWRADCQAWLYLQDRDEQPVNRNRLLAWLVACVTWPWTLRAAVLTFVCSALGCRYCLTYQAAIWLAVVCWYAPQFSPPAVAAALTLPLYAFAAARVVTLASVLRNDLIAVFAPEPEPYTDTEELSSDEPGIRVFTDSPDPDVTADSPPPY